MNDLPLVSISCVTFNHAPYLRECFDSFLMQQCDFKFEILIHDDASTDGTREIIEEYTQNNPEIFFPIYQTTNQYSLGVRRMMARFNFPRCRGKFIALCEGDDYWTDPLKLQKQVDFLQNNSHYVLLGGRASQIYEKENFQHIHHLNGRFTKNFDFDTKYLMLKNPLSTLTAIFRNGLIEKFPDLYFEGSGGDRRLYMLLSQYGKCRFSNDVLGVYRIHSGGLTNQHKGSYLNRIKGFKEYIKNAENWNNYFNDDYRNELLIAKHHYSVKIVKLLFKNKKWRETKPYLSNINFSEVKFKTKIIILLIKINSFFLKIKALFRK